MQEGAPQESMTVMEQIRFHVDSVVRLSVFLEAATTNPTLSSEMIEGISKSKQSHLEILKDLLKTLQGKGVTLQEVQDYLKLK